MWVEGKLKSFEISREFAYNHVNRAQNSKERRTYYPSMLRRQTQRLTQKKRTKEMTARLQIAVCDDTP